MQMLKLVQSSLSSSFLDVIWTTPTEVLGVLPVIVIFGLREYSQYCYTTANHCPIRTGHVMHNKMLLGAKQFSDLLSHSTL